MKEKRRKLRRGDKEVEDRRREEETRGGNLGKDTRNGKGEKRRG